MQEAHLGSFKIGVFEFDVSLKSPGSSYSREWFTKVFSRFQTTRSTAGRGEATSPVSAWELPHGKLTLLRDCNFVVELNSSQQSEIVASLSQAEICIVNHAVSRLENNLWVHGACLAKDGQLVFFIAPSGGGKTTLSLAFLSHGFRLVTDDVIVITKEDLAIQPFPRCPKIRRSASRQLSSLDYDVLQNAELLGRYLVLPEDVWVNSAIEISDVPKTFFILAQRETRKTPRELDTPEFMLEWPRYSNLLYQDNSELSLLKKLLRNSRAYKMPVSPLRETVKHIRTLAHIY